MEKNIQDSENFLTVRDLCVEYTSEKEIIHAVNGVSFTIAEGKTLGLVGETGAGKTSIAKAILRILPDISSKITGGKVYLEGVDLLALEEKDMRKLRGNKISMIFQDPMTALNPVQRVIDQIAESVLLHNEISRAEANIRAIEMLKMVGISEDRVYEYPHQFSGGMKQRVIIAMAIACNPRLLLADEPTTALDVTIQAQVLSLIQLLREKYNTSMLLITHDLGVVAETCDDVAVIYAGEIVEYGSREDIFDRPTHPYTIGLFGALPDVEKKVARLSPIGGLPPDPTCLPTGCKFSPRCPRATEACLNAAIPLTEVGAGHVCRCCNIDREEA